ncbi:hypothetical protein NP493_460g02049 [Ridgeia piscesae]|uniref:LicD/FKTN/FKRP nucleotidyltransferase domain-containing protein n=1 Tax=Ridgeia piscesae TaxID=27915 RepID=A0AAD9KZ90_RIDPI|nr:hypothetical protein NP493_460g02049 [Ridgeia piscesae]
MFNDNHHGLDQRKSPAQCYQCPTNDEIVFFFIIRTHSRRKNGASEEGDRRATVALTSLLPRVITRDERDRCIELLSTVDAIFREFNITYMLAHGTLLGSYVMHDMLPWDDDLDIFVNIDDLPKIKRLFNASGVGHYKQIQLLKTENKSALTAKVFSLKDPKAGVYRWHWPYIDISFYTDRNMVMSSHQAIPRWELNRGETERLKRATDALPWLSHHLLPRVITRDERDRCIELLSTVDAIFREFNITYMLAHGTLLGSYVMHDMLPWDDDLDIFVNLDDLPKIKRLFNASGVGHYKQIQLLETENESSLTAKVFSLKDPNAGVYRWHWPYIDIAFYTDKNMVMSSHQATPRWELNRGYFFPTVQRPLGGRWFPTPRNTSAFIAYKYKHFVCKSHTWNHKKEVFTNRLYSVNCITLASHYPFVERKVLLGKTTETLTLNCTARYSLTLQE